MQWMLSIWIPQGTKCRIVAMLIVLPGFMTLTTAAWDAAPTLDTVILSTWC